jgi:hypothetical protein
MSNISTNIIILGSAQVVGIEIVRTAAGLLDGYATIAYHQFGRSGYRLFRLEIGSPEAERLLRESLYNGSEFRLDVYDPESRAGLFEKLLTKHRFFFGMIKSRDVASMSLDFQTRSLPR